MKTNMSAIDRAVRVVLGLGFVSLFFLRDDAVRWLALLGPVLIGTALVGWCPTTARSASAVRGLLSDRERMRARAVNAGHLLVALQLAALAAIAYPATPVSSTAVGAILCGIGTALEAWVLAFNRIGNFSVLPEPKADTKLQEDDARGSGVATRFSRLRRLCEADRPLHPPLVSQVMWRLLRTRAEPLAASR